MKSNKWTLAREVNGEFTAENLRALLQAQGIQVYLNQEGAGRAYGLSVGPLGKVQILVPEEQLIEAQQILNQFDQGEFESADNGLDSQE
jgi:hypothetical protein